MDDIAWASLGITFLILITKYRNNYQTPPTTPLRLELLMNLPYLLLYIHALHPLQILALFQLPIIARRRLLPPRGLLVADDRLARYPVKHITALGSKAFEVGGYIRGGEVGGGLAQVGFGALFLPAGVEEFDCNSVLVEGLGRGGGNGEGTNFSCVDLAPRRQSVVYSLDTTPLLRSVFWPVREARNRF